MRSGGWLRSGRSCWPCEVIPCISTGPSAARTTVMRSYFTRSSNPTMAVGWGDPSSTLRKTVHLSRVAIISSLEHNEPRKVVVDCCRCSNLAGLCEVVPSIQAWSWSLH